MKYQHFSEKLMVLDREEEAKRIMMGGGAQGAAYGGMPGDRDYYGGGYGDGMGHPGAAGGPGGAVPHSQAAQQSSDMLMNDIP